MNAVHFKSSPDHEYPTIELDMTNFMEHLSDELICKNAEVRDNCAETNQRKLNFKTEDCTDLGEIPSVSEVGLEREEKVRKFNTKLYTKHKYICYETLW